MENDVLKDSLTGEPKDVEGECNARLYIGDNLEDNHVTARCFLLPGHEGPHKVEFFRHGKPIAITWWVDEHGEEDVWY